MHSFISLSCVTLHIFLIFIRICILNIKKVCKQSPSISKLNNKQKKYQKQNFYEILIVI